MMPPVLDGSWHLTFKINIVVENRDFLVLQLHSRYSTASKPLKLGASDDVRTIWRQGRQMPVLRGAKILTKKCNPLRL